MCIIGKSLAHINTHTRVAPSLSHSLAELAPFRIHPRHLLLLSSMHIVHLLLIHIACFVILVSQCFAPSFDSAMFSIRTRRSVCGAVRQTLVEVSSGSDFIYCLDDEIAMFFHPLFLYLSLSLSPAKILCPYYCWCFLLLFSIRFGRSAAAFAVCIAYCTFFSNTIYFENFFTSSNLINFQTVVEKQTYASKWAERKHTDTQTHFSYTRAITFSMKSLNYKMWY